MRITNRIGPDPSQIALTRLAPGVTVEVLREKTEAGFDVGLENNEVAAWA